MYIIEFRESWTKKKGKLSFCKVLKDEKAKQEVSQLLGQYVNDLTELISAKLSKIKDNYDVPEREIKKIRALVEELRHAHEMKCKQ